LKLKILKKLQIEKTSTIASEARQSLCTTVFAAIGLFTVREANIYHPAITASHHYSRWVTILIFKEYLRTVTFPNFYISF